MPWIEAAGLNLSIIRPSDMKNKSTGRLLRDGILVAALLTGALPSLAAGNSDEKSDETKSKYPEWDRAALDFGGNVVGLNSSVGFGARGSTTVTISAESLLGMETSLFIMAGGGYYRFGDSKRNQVSFSYSAYHRTGDANIAQDIEINGIILPTGTHVSSVFNFDIINLSWSYAIIQDERVRIAAGLGVYVAPIKYGLTWSSSLGGGGGQQETITVPLPTLNLDAEIRLTPKLSLIGSIDALYVKLNGFSGSLLNTYIGLEYRLWRNFGLGLTFNALSVNVEGTVNVRRLPGWDFVGAVNVQYGGLFMYGKLTF